MPNALSAVVLDHHHDGPLVYAELIGVVPPGPDVEGIAEAIFGPNTAAKAAVKSAQSWYRILRCEGHGSTGGSRRNRPVIGRERREAAGLVAIRRWPITGRQPPDRAAVSN